MCAMLDDGVGAATENLMPLARKARAMVESENILYSLR